MVAFYSRWRRAIIGDFETLSKKIWVFTLIYVELPNLYYISGIRILFFSCLDLAQVNVPEMSELCP